MQLYDVEQLFKHYKTRYSTFTYHLSRVTDNVVYVEIPSYLRYNKICSDTFFASPITFRYFRLHPSLI